MKIMYRRQRMPGRFHRWAVRLLILYVFLTLTGFVTPGALAATSIVSLAPATPVQDGTTVSEAVRGTDPGGNPPPAASDTGDQQLGMWASIKETLAKIREALCMSCLLAEVSGWIIDLFTEPARVLFTGVFGMLLVTTPLELEPLVTGPYRTSVTISVIVIAAALGYLAYLIIKGGGDKPGEGKTGVGQRAGMLVVAAVMGVMALRLLDLAVLAQNASALNTAISQGITAADGGAYGCAMPTAEPALSDPAVWALGVRGCGEALMATVFGAKGEALAADAGGLKSLRTAGVLLAIPYGIGFFLIGLVLFFRSLVLWALAVGAPIWFALSVANPVTAVGWLAMTIRTLLAPWIFILAFIVYQSAVEGAFSAIGVGGPSSGDLSGGGAALIGMVVFTLAFGAFIWLWLLPTVKAALAPATLAGGTVLASGAGLVGKIAGAAGVIGALTGNAPLAAGAASVAAGAAAARNIGEEMRDAGRGEQRVEKSWDFWSKTSRKAGDAVRRGLQGTGDAPTVDRVSRTTAFIPLSERLTETDAAAAKAFLRSRGLSETEWGYDAEAVAHAVSRYEERFVDVADPATGAVMGQDLSAVFGAPGHMRHELAGYLRERGIGSARVIPGDPATGRDGGVAVSIQEEMDAAALVSAFWTNRVFTEAADTQTAFVRVTTSPEQVDEVEAVLRNGFPHRQLMGIPERVPIRKAVVNGRGELLLPVEYTEQVERILNVHRRVGTPYWEAGGGRYVVEVHGLPVVTGVRPEDGRNMGRWTGRVPDTTGGERRRE